MSALACYRQLGYPINCLGFATIDFSKPSDAESDDHKIFLLFHETIR
jgi:hypothetical protein